jgi:hypothetical protein
MEWVSTPRANGATEGSTATDWRATAINYQLFGRPFQLGLDAERRPLGGDWSGELRHPFFTDVQRVAWRAAFGSSVDYFPFTRPDAEDRRCR